MKPLLIILFGAQMCLGQKHLQSLRTAATRWERAIDNKKPDSIAYYFAEDVIAMYPHPLPTYGREANLKAWQRVYENPNNTHPITVDEINVSESGEIGYIMGKWWSRSPDKNYFNGGRYLAIWIKIDGNWKISRLSANSNDDVKNDRESN